MNTKLMNVLSNRIDFKEGKVIVQQYIQLIIGKKEKDQQSDGGVGS